MTTELTVWRARFAEIALGVGLLLFQALAWGRPITPEGRAEASGATASAALTASAAEEADRTSELEQLRESLRRQQREIEQLREALERQAELLSRIAQPQPGSPAVVPAVLRSAPEVGTASAEQTIIQPVANQTQAAGPPQADLERLSRTTADLSRSIAGFRFSGDFRFRLDAQLRPGNAVAGPLQNVRSRYRLRVNLDKDLDPRFAFHLQLSTAPFNNIITNDQDMGGIAAKHPFTISETYIDFRATSNLRLRGGRMSEIFADNMRFLWDDDVRFNGFHQIFTIPLPSGPLGFRQLELRSAEYYLTNPNVAILGSNSPFVGAGYWPGQKVRDAMLFHPGFVLSGNAEARWRQILTGDIQLYRNPNQIQLAATTEGFPVTVNGALGLALSGPIGGTGNATAAPGGARYFARHFQVARFVYRLEGKALPLGSHRVPAWLDVQLSRNVGTSKLRDAFMISVNLGEVTTAGTMRFLYQYAIKDANALISQFTDDDLGTGTGVNLAVHALRFDIGFTRFLQWQNLVFLQTERRPSNPTEGFFVPLQRGAGFTYRYLGQLAFSF